MSGPLNETPRELTAPASCFGLCQPRWSPPVHPLTVFLMALALAGLWPRVGPGDDGSGLGHVLLVALAVALAVALVVSLLRIILVWPQMTRRTPVPVTVHVERDNEGDILVLASLDGRAWMARASDLALRWPRLGRSSRPRWAVQVRPLSDPSAHPIPDEPREVAAGELIFPRRSRTVGLVLHRRPGTSDVLPDRPTEDGSDLEQSERWAQLFDYVDFVGHSDCVPVYMVRSRFVGVAGPSGDRAPSDDNGDEADTTSMDGALRLLQSKVKRGDSDAADAMSLFRSIAQADAEGKVVDPRRRAHLETMLRNEPLDEYEAEATPGIPLAPEPALAEDDPSISR